MSLDGLWRKLDEMRMRASWTRGSESISEFFSLLFPTECVVCEQPDSSMCPNCASALRGMTVRPFRAEDGAEGLPVRYPGLPGNDPRALLPLPVLAAGPYAKSLAAAMLAFKNHGHTDIMRWLQAALAGALHEACRSLGPHGGEVLLVPVPSRSASTRRRGYDPLSLLLAGLARRRELPAGATIVPAVRHVAGVRSLRGAFPPRSGQKALGRRGRRRNVVGSMDPNPAYGDLLRGRTCLVVDDVLTTGATIAETTRVLRGRDALVAGAVVIAATSAPRREGGDEVAFETPGKQSPEGRAAGSAGKKTHG